MFIQADGGGLIQVWASAPPLRADYGRWDATSKPGRSTRRSCNDGQAKRVFALYTGRRYDTMERSACRQDSL
jgi:hypothetical protein